ncbi:hypothetical protein [Pseudomonas phage LKA1]|uniref:Uncharacterized protein n=1 Tax=Pseudomonas phage LKA1 TaxID=386793 RepID=Q0E603_9CAUD|nr:hypothetical protein AV952_gp11 [Pseudomonas phage LKA1]CAK24979.1 hypothetical protein [Pseudomonas phage LKA1]
MYLPPKTVTRLEREAPAYVSLLLSVTQAYHLCKLMHDAVSGRALDETGLRAVYEALLSDLGQADICVGYHRIFDHRGQAVRYIGAPDLSTIKRLEELDAQA